MDAIIAWLMGFDWWIYVASVVTVASAVTAALPSTLKDKPGWNIVMKVINVLSGAIANAKLKDDNTTIKVTDK